jgi:hypothetical protein
VGATAQAWAPIGPERYNLSPTAPTSAPTELHSIATPTAGAAAEASPLSPENPLFWFGALAAVTFGLMAFSTSVRVGGTTASLNLGSTGGK